MLTGIENLKETMKKDGHPDRFVKQYEFLHILLPDTYYMGDYPLPPNPGEGYDQYGVFWKLPAGFTMEAFPFQLPRRRELFCAIPRTEGRPRRRARPGLRRD